MSDKTARQAEKVAATLLDEYLSECQQGRQPHQQDFLERCPAAGQQMLQEAIEGADLYIRYFHCAHVRPHIMEKTLQGLEAIRRKKVWLAATRERAAQVWNLDLAAPTDSLAALINIQIAQDGVSRAISTSSRPPLVLNRGKGQGIASTLLDRTWRRAREQHITQIVEELLEKLGVNSTPVDLEQITQRLFLFVQEADLGETEGCLVTDGEVGGILLNRQSATLQRKRFTWAHEIGHFILHKHMVAFRDTQQEILDDPSAPHEIEANIFAALLLLPLSLLPKDFGKSRPTLQEADLLTSQFQVSLEAALRRMLGQSNWRCALVISRYGRVVRFASSPLFEDYIQKRTVINSDSAACKLKQVGEEGMSILPAHAWLHGALAQEEAEIQEQSRCLSDDFVYSLLTVLDPD